jgi:hypothetical protein
LTPENEAESKQREARREAGRKGGLRSGEARRRKREEPTDQQKAHETLVDSLQSSSAIARIQAAKELLSRKPAEPEAEPRQYRHGINLPGVVVHGVAYGVSPETIADVGMLEQALRLADSSSGHAQQAATIRARLIELGSGAPPSPVAPPDEKGPVLPGEWLTDVPAPGGPTPDSEQEEIAVDENGDENKDENAMVMYAGRLMPRDQAAIARSIEEFEAKAEQARLRAALGLDKGAA